MTTRLVQKTKQPKQTTQTAVVRVRENKAGKSNNSTVKMMSAIGSLVRLVFKNLDVIAGPVISLLYPLYASVRAIESRTHGDDKQWLTYWALYSLVKLFELTFYRLIEWIPLWPYAKLALTCWLVLPGLSGASYLYENYVRSFLLSPHTVNVWYVPAKKDEDDLATAAGKFTPVNDSGDEKRVSSVDTSAKYVGHSAFDDTYIY